MQKDFYIIEGDNMPSSPEYDKHDSEKLVCLQARILACQIEFEGMKAQNQFRRLMNDSPAYTETQFEELLKRYGFDHLDQTPLCDFFHNMD